MPDVVGIGRDLRDGAAADRLIYAGKVGTGFGATALIELRRRFTPLLRATCPFAPPPQRAWVGAAVHWLEPSLVCEVAFVEWTADGRLRHPSFQGLRLDKRAADVVREIAASADAHRAPGPARSAAKRVNAR